MYKRQAPDIEKYPVILIDNRQGVELAVNELLAKGNTDIQYLCNPLPMYNYLSRRRGFQEIMKQKGLGDASDRIINTGSSIEEVHQMMREYLKTAKLPQAYIMESYHVSMGTIMAMHELNTVSYTHLDVYKRQASYSWYGRKQN